MTQENTVVPTAVEQPPSAITHVDPPAASASSGAQPGAGVQAQAVKGEVLPPASDVDLDLDSALIQFTVRLGGERFLVTEASIETQKNILRALPAGDEKKKKRNVEIMDALLPSLDLAASGEKPTAEQLTASRVAVDTALRSLREELDDDDADHEESLRNIDSIYPQLERILTYVEGANKGKPPSKEFVERHLRTSTLRKLMNRLSPDEDAEGKS